jgi:hypothetical protein
MRRELIGFLFLIEICSEVQTDRIEYEPQAVWRLDELPSTRSSNNLGGLCTLRKIWQIKVYGIQIRQRINSAHFPPLCRIIAIKSLNLGKVIVDSTHQQSGYTHMSLPLGSQMFDLASEYEGPSWVVCWGSESNLLSGILWRVWTWNSSPGTPSSYTLWRFWVWASWGGELMLDLALPRPPYNAL